MATSFFIFSAIGFLFVQRFSQKYISNRVNKNLLRAIFVIFAAMFSYFARKTEVIFLIVGFFLIASVVFDFILIRKQKKAALLRGISFLDEVILLVRSGRSLKNSVENSLKSQVNTNLGIEFESYYRDHFVKEHPVREKNLLHPQNLFLELGKIAKSKSSALDQLVLLRRHLKLVDNLRHKSSQAGLQAEVQAGVLLVIYLLLVAAMIIFFGFERIEPFFVTSLMPMLLGVFFVHRISKWFRWKI